MDWGYFLLRSIDFARCECLQGVRLKASVLYSLRRENCCQSSLASDSKGSQVLLSTDVKLVRRCLVMVVRMQSTNLMRFFCFPLRFVLRFSWDLLRFPYRGLDLRWVAAWFTMRAKDSPSNDIRTLQVRVRKQMTIQLSCDSLLVERNLIK